MLKSIFLLPFLAFLSCTPALKKSESQVKGNIASTANPCAVKEKGPQVSKNRQQFLNELKTLIKLHGDINKKEEYMESVLNALTSRFVSFSTDNGGDMEKKLNLIPFFQKCCTEELQASQYLSYGSCLDRTFSRVIPYENKLNQDLLILGKGLLLELSSKGRRGWCQYIDTEWSFYKG